MLGRRYFRKCRTELKKIRGTSAHTEVPRIGEKFYVPLYSGEREVYKAAKIQSYT